MVFRVLAALVVLSSTVIALWLGSRAFDAADASSVPIAPVRSGEFLAVIRTRGQIQAQRSYPIYAPLAQDLRIAWMAPSGEVVEEGEPLIRFDSSSAERDLIERRAAVDRAQANLDQALADLDVEAQHDELDLIDARLNVELVQLRTLDSEFVGRLEAEQGQIDLRVAEQNLRQIEAEIAQGVVAGESRLASLGRQLAQAEAEVRVLEFRIAGMEVLAPTRGSPLYATGSTSLAAALAGQSQAPLRVGDAISAGRTLGTIPDLTSLLIDVTVEEIDRGRMKPGDEVIVRVDALPEVSIPATVTGISPLAEMAMDSRGRSFHAYAALGPGADPRVQPGMNGSMDIIVERIPDALVIPAQALFTRDGKPVVYLVDPSGAYLRREVEVLSRNADEIAIHGIPPDSRVVLVDPSTIGRGGAPESESPPSGGADGMGRPAGPGMPAGLPVGRP
jgi:multidrug efflux pump subunit AcrA (membrane-fusion protein)